MQRERLEDLDQTGAQTLAWWQDAWARNMALNASFLQKGRKSGKVKAAHKLPKILEPRPAIITGSGSSLDEFPFENLGKDCEQFTIFCSVSNINSWLAHGIIPDYVVAVDSASALLNFQYKPTDDYKKITLLTTPTINHKFLLKWPGPIVIFRPHQPGMDLVEQYLPKMYADEIETEDARNRFFVPQFPIGFINAGCTVNSMIENACYLGYEPLFLVGVDFGYSNGKPGSLRYAYDKKQKKWIGHEHKGLFTMEQLRLSKNGIRTTSELLHYKLQFYIVWSMTRARIYNCSTKSILGNTVPVVSPIDLALRWRGLYENYPINESRLYDYCMDLAVEMGVKDQRQKPQEPPAPASVGNVQVVNSFESLPPAVQEEIKNKEKKENEQESNS